MKIAPIAIALGLASGVALAQAPAGDAARGKAAYMKQGCYTCHGTVGQGGDRGSGPRIAYDVEEITAVQACLVVSHVCAPPAAVDSE